MVVCLSIPDEVYGVMKGAEDPLPDPLYTGELLQGAVTVSYHQGLGEHCCHFLHLFHLHLNLIVNIFIKTIIMYTNSISQVMILLQTLH